MKSRKNRIVYSSLGVFLVFCAILLLSGCGYTTRSSIFPRDVKTVHIEVFRNNIDITKEVSAKDKYEIYRPNLEVDLRDVIVDRIFLDGHLKVKAKEDADAILEGEIYQYRKDPLRYQNEDVTEYKISLVCNIRLKRSRDLEILLEHKGLTGDTTYFTTGALQESETQALNNTLQDLARRIVNRIVEDW